jgi:hypothetical protein
MQRIGFFSIRGFWMTPLAVFATSVVTVVALSGWQKLGLGLGLGVACSLIIGFVYSIQASLNQSVLDVMHQVDSSLQLVDCSLNVWGDTHFKINSARWEWQIDIPNSNYSRRAIFRGPNQLYRVIGTGPRFAAEIREMMRSVGCVSAGAQAAEVAEPSPKGKAWRGWLWIGCGAALLCWTVWRAVN